MKFKLLLAGFGLLFLNATAVFAELDPLENYDNFNTKKYNGCKFCINSDLWAGRERGERNAEVVREIKSKRAHLSHRSWGRSDSDAGRETGRNRLQFRDSVDFSGVCFSPRLNKYQVKNCAANEETGRAQIRYIGNYYYTVNAGDGGDDGVVYAGIAMTRPSEGGASKKRVGVSAFVEECAGAGCETDAWSTYDGIDDPDLFFGVFKGNKNKKEMCVGYDRANAEFVISFGNDVRVVNAADHGLPALDTNMDANWTWHVIETRTDTENCVAGALSSFVDADVDNVKIREFQ